MRIWHPIPPFCLDRKRLLGEHNELHAIFKILSKKLPAYRHHPEVLRWKGSLTALSVRHELLAKEMKNRGYNHKSPLATTHLDTLEWPETWQTIEEMRELLAKKQQSVTASTVPK